MDEPIRTESAITPTTSSGNQKYESAEHEIAFSVPEGWLLQTPDKTESNAPDVVAVGPKTGVMNPVISLTVQETGDRTLKDLISEKTITLQEILESGNLRIISQEETTLNGNDVYVLEAEGYFSSNDEKFNVKFKEILIYDTEKYYTLAYSNGLDYYNSQLPRFEETIDSFEILSQETSNIESSTEEGGGCLIATATFGSELAPQVQQLREIRDNKLMNTESGSAFMSTFNEAYYSFSPIIADMERESPVFKEIVKLGLTPMLSTLAIMENADSESEVLGLGLSVIALNLGMYIAAPVMMFYGISKKVKSVKFS